MAASYPLRIPDAEAFQAALQEHLGKGGAVLQMESPPPVQSRIVVALELVFCDQRMLLDADVVQAVPGGVAVQFLEPADALRERLVALVEPPAPADDLFGEGDLFDGEPPEASEAAPAPASGAGLDHAEVDLEPSDDSLELGEPGTGHAEPHVD